MTHRRNPLRGEWLAGGKWGKGNSEVCSSSLLAVPVLWINGKPVSNFTSLPFVNLSKQTV